MDKYKEHAETRCQCVFQKHEGDRKAFIYELMERRTILEDRLNTSGCDKQRAFDRAEISYITKTVNDYFNYTNPLYTHNQKP